MTSGEEVENTEGTRSHGAYQQYLEAMVDPDHEEHSDYLEWRGPLDPEEFPCIMLQTAAFRDQKSVGGGVRRT